MEVPYRNTKLPLKLIPKGTILFRITESSDNDLRGVPLTDGTRCLTPNFNVFFFPNPFMWKMALEKWSKKEFANALMCIYVLIKDVKVLSLVDPSKYARTTKNKSGTFITKCSKVSQGCLPKKGNSYDPCFSKTLIQKFPDIVGMQAVSFMDGLKTQRYLTRNKHKTQKIKKYIHFAEDSAKFHPSPPELILHPLSRRPSENVIVHEEDSLDLNYKLLQKIPYNEEILLQYMKTLRYNPSTYFFEE